jgi:hypothetical protein
MFRKATIRFRGLGAAPFDPFLFINFGLTDHSFHCLYGVTCVGKIDANNYVRLTILTAFEPGLMRTTSCLVKTETMLPKKIDDIPVPPVA